MVTLKQIAKEVGVSQVTVSNVLNGKNRNVRREAAKRAELIRSVAARLGYRPHGAARAMRSRKSNMVGLLVEAHPLAYETILGITEGLDHAGYLTVLSYFKAVVDRTAGKNSIGGRIFRENIVDGAIIANISDFNYGRVENSLPPHRIIIESNFWHPERCIRRDEVNAGWSAAQGGYQAGYRKLLYVERNNHNDLYCYADRWAGVSRFAEEHGLGVERLQYPIFPNPDIRIPKGKVTADTAVIVSDAYFVLPVEHCMEQQGMVWGRDYGLICTDDSNEFSVSWPELARVSFNRYEMGYQAAQMLSQILANPDAPCPSQMVRGRFIKGSTIRSA